MDAQQRLLLERFHEALRAVPAPNIAQRTAVFVGIGTVDYVTMSAHLGVGMYVASGAIQHTIALDLCPVLTVPAVAYAVSVLSAVRVISAQMT